MNPNMLQFLLLIMISMRLQALEVINVKFGAQKDVQLSSQKDNFQSRYKRSSENSIAISKLSHLIKLILKMMEKIVKIEAKLDMALSDAIYNQEAQRRGDTPKEGLQVKYVPLEIYIPIQKTPAVTYNHVSEKPSILHWNSDKNNDNSLATHWSTEKNSEIPLSSQTPWNSEKKSDKDSDKPLTLTTNRYKNNDTPPTPPLPWIKASWTNPPRPPLSSNKNNDKSTPLPWNSNENNVNSQPPPPPPPPWISNMNGVKPPPPPWINNNKSDNLPLPPPPPWVSGMPHDSKLSPNLNRNINKDVSSRDENDIPMPSTNIKTLDLKNVNKKDMSAPMTKRSRFLSSHSTWIHKKCSEPCGVNNAPDSHDVMSRSSSPNRIVGGVEAAKHKYPWQVFVQIYFDVGRTGRCGGSIINDHYILTAAHCTYKGDKACSVEAKPEDITVTVAEHNINSIHDDVIGVTDRLDIDRIIRHHMYCNGNNEMDNDIALLRLKETLVFIDTPELGFVCLPEGPWEDYIGEMGIVAGWGYTQHTFQEREDEDLADTLQEVAVRIHENCDEYKNQEDITMNMFCAGNTNDFKDACSGDSGGPMVVEREDQHQLVGIVSFGPEGGNCTGQGVYVRVNKYIPWIRENTLDAGC